jgi:hypothetical protein
MGMVMRRRRRYGNGHKVPLDFILLFVDVF